jgi:sulfite dehydrogenase
MTAAGTLQRRRLLVASTALAAASIAGCATSVGTPIIGRVVVVGGGFGGATAAHYLALWGGGQVDVTLVERNAQFVSCPLSNLVLGGHLQLADITRSYGSLAASGVRRVQGEVSAIDTAARTVRLADGRSLPYDRLVLSPGVDFMTDGVAGLDAALASGRVQHAWKAGPATSALRRQIEAMQDGDVFAMTIPLAPYRCPPGPYERACMVASWLKLNRPRAKLVIFDANPDITSKKGLFLKAWGDHYKDLIEYQTNATLREVAADGSAKFDFEDVRAAVLNVIPAQRAGDIARQAGVVNVNDRWCGVHWLTMESTAVPGLHVLGDATLSAAAMPKSGHMANQHAKLAAAAIIQLLRGEAVNASPMLTNTCYSFVTASEAVHVASVHQYDAADKTFKTVPGAGGLSVAASQIEGRYALGWAQNIWKDMLA